MKSRQMNPLTDPPPCEVPLSDAPLACVVAQLRFPLIASVANPTFVGPFQEAIRSRYPVLRQEQLSPMVLLGHQMQMPASAMIPTVWRFSDNAGWEVALSSDFLAILTRCYSSRDDFLARLDEVISALGDHIKPATVDRLGIRYVDRVVNAGAEDMREMINPTVLGIASTDMAHSAVHSITETLLHSDNHSLMARWGHLPPQATIDPSVAPPVETPSWILDLDAYTEGSHQFDVLWVRDEARLLAERAYAFFRWAVTDTFLKRYGGQI